jgi:hypothetical protein
VGMERGPLILVCTIEELLGRNSSGSGLENRDMAVGISHADHATPFYPQKLAITSLTNGGLSVGIVRWRTQATEFVFISNCINDWIFISIFHVKCSFIA